MKNIYFYLSVILIATSLLACDSNEAQVNRRLLIAEKSIDNDTETARKQIDSIPTQSVLSEELYNKYVLIKAQIDADDKFSLSIPSLVDTSIYPVVNYYLEVRDYQHAAQAAICAAKIANISGDTAKAMKLYGEANGYLKDLEKNSLRFNGLIELGIGELYLQQSHNQQKALMQFKNAMQSFIRSEDSQNMLRAYGNIISVFLNKGQMDSVDRFLILALDSIKTESRNIRRNKAQILNSIGEFYLQKSMPDTAYSYFRKALGYLPNNKSDQALVYYNLTQVFGMKNQADSNIYYVNKTLQALKSTPFMYSTNNLYELLANYEENLKMDKNALSIYKTYAEVVGRSSNDRINRLQHNYDTDVETLLRKSGNKQILIYILCGIMFLFLCSLLIFLYKSSNKRNEKEADHEADLAKLYNQVDELNLKIDGCIEEKKLFKEIVGYHFSILKKGISLDTFLREDERSQGRRLLKKFNETLYGKEVVDWKPLEDAMMYLYDGFPQKLKDRYPHLDQAEYRICCLTYAKFDNTEIGIIMELSLNTIQIKKTNIRKKLGMEKNGNIAAYLEIAINKKAGLIEEPQEYIEPES